MFSTHAYFGVNRIYQQQQNTQIIMFNTNRVAHRIAYSHKKTSIIIIITVLKQSTACNNNYYYYYLVTCELLSRDAYYACNYSLYAQKPDTNYTI